MNNATTRITTAAAAGCAVLIAAAAWAQSSISGLEIGSPTASIPVLDITGEYAGQRICYVCEFQDVPNVLAFFRETSDETANLIRQLDELYLRHKHEDFKAVAAIVAGDEASPWLEELSASAGLEIPLVVFRRGPRDVAMRLYEINPEIDNTFLVTVNRFVVDNISGIGSDEFGRVVDATELMMAQNTP